MIEFDITMLVAARDEFVTRKRAYTTFLDVQANLRKIGHAMTTAEWNALIRDNYDPLTLATNALREQIELFEDVAAAMSADPVTEFAYSQRAMTEALSWCPDVASANRIVDKFTADTKAMLAKVFASVEGDPPVPWIVTALDDIKATLAA